MWLDLYDLVSAVYVGSAVAGGLSATVYLSGFVRSFSRNDAWRLHAGIIAAQSASAIDSGVWAAARIGGIGADLQHLYTTTSIPSYAFDGGVGVVWLKTLFFAAGVLHLMGWAEARFGRPWDGAIVAGAVGIALCAALVAPALGAA